MSLKNTIKTQSKPTPEEIVDILKETGLKESNNSALKNEQVDRTVKVNVILTYSDHTLYKLHCHINDVNMQDKAKELILEWLSKQPKLGI